LRPAPAGRTCKKVRKKVRTGAAQERPVCTRISQ
jgi:hypothetical protein